MTNLKIELDKELKDEYNVDADKQALLRLHKLLTGHSAVVDDVKFSNVCNIENSVSSYTGYSIISVRVVSTKVLGDFSTETAWEYYQQMCMRYTKREDIPEDHYENARRAFVNLEIGEINNEQALEILIRVAMEINHKDEDVSKEENINNEIVIGLAQKLYNKVKDLPI